jgi:uncharacterized metal-binding protein YceD (DUF177 family)
MPEARPEGPIINLARQSRADLPFALSPEAPDRAHLAAELGIAAIRKLRFAGTLTPEGARDWHLVAQLGATVVQPCVVTLAPVTTRLDVAVTRRYVADWQEPQGEEAEMPQDDTTEALPERIDLSAVMAEALALVLPDYPRVPDAEIGTAQFAAPGVAPMTDDEAKPLAGLAGLRDRMREDPDESDNGAEG